MLVIAKNIFSEAESLRHLSLRYHESAHRCDSPRWIEAGTFELVEPGSKVLAVHESVMNKMTKESRFYRVKIEEVLW
jgi:hypothetical protein